VHSKKIDKKGRQEDADEKKEKPQHQKSQQRERHTFIYKEQVIQA